MMDPLSMTLTASETQAELDRIADFIRSCVHEGEQVVVAVSGGLDSDLVARLCCCSLGRDRVRLFIVRQSEMEPVFLENARQLADDLQVPLAEFPLEDASLILMQALEAGEPEIFSSTARLDTGKAKCSLRSAILSSYQDKGYLIAGSTNRSEKELGFFLTFGDNLAHFKPIAHLYKSQLPALAACMGTRAAVLDREPSPGFWPGQTDLEDLAFWIVNDGPILRPTEFSEAETARAADIRKHLSYSGIDRVLCLRNAGMRADAAAEQSGLPLPTVEGLFHIVEKAARLKNCAILQEIPVRPNRKHAVPQAG